MSLSRCLRAALAGVVLSTSAAAAATFRVEQYDGYLGTDLATYQAHAAANTPDFVGFFDVIDFTDDPGGFVGNRPGSNPWPGQTATGQSGISAAVNQTFFARITAQMSVAVADTFTFRTYNDDGVFLLVNGDLVINDPSLHPEKEFTGTKALGVGTHDIELFFFENGGEASLEFSFKNSAAPYTWAGNSETLFAAPVPLPATAVLMLAAIGGLGAVARKRKAG